MPLKQLTDTLIESIRSVLPISAIVLILSITLSPMQSGVLVLFLFGTILLIFGMALFTIGSNTSMHPLGVGIGVQLHKSKKSLLPLLASFLLGVIITIAEPDLQVLARQIPSIPNLVLILAVAIGVGIFLMVAMVRAKRRLPLNLLLLIFYGVLFLLAFFAPEDFIPAAFDSGGVTTGPITVPFIMALGAGLATTASQKNEEGSFGLVALCSIGPILSVLLLSLFYTPDATSSEIVIGELFTTKDAFQVLWHALPEYAWEVFIAMGPIALVFILFELVFRRFHRHEVFRIAVGLLYTYAGPLPDGGQCRLYARRQTVGSRYRPKSFEICADPRWPAYGLVCSFGRACGSCAEKTGRRGYLRSHFAKSHGHWPVHRRRDSRSNIHGTGTYRDPSFPHPAGRLYSFSGHQFLCSPCIHRHCL